MSQTGREVAFAITARAEAYYNELRKIPGWTEDAARKASDSWARAAAAASAKQAAGIKASADNAAKAWGDVGKQLGALAGGPFAQLGQVVFELGPKAAGAAEAFGALAAAGAGVGVAAAAVAGVALAAWKLAEAGQAAADRMAKAGRAAEIPREATEGLEAFARASKGLRDRWDELLVVWGGRAGFVIAGLVDRVASVQAGVESFGRELAGSKERLEGFTAAMTRIRDVLVAVGSLGLVPLIGYLESAGKEAEKTAGKVGEAASKLSVDLALAEAEGEEARRKASAARGERQIEEARRQAEAAAKAAAEARRKIEEEESARRRAELLAWLDESEQIELDASAALREELLAQNEAALDAETEARKKAAAEQVAIAERAASASAAATVDGLRAIEEELGGLQASWRDSYRQLGDAAMDLGHTISDALTRAAEDGTMAQKRAARDFAVKLKAMELAAAVISGFAAVAKAAASAPPPLNIPAIAVATATGAAQVAGILATPIPSAFGGRTAPGEETIRAHRGETVLTSRTTEALLRLLNERLSPLAALPGLAAAGTGGAGAIVLDTEGRRIGRLRESSRAGRPPPGYRRPW